MSRIADIQDLRRHDLEEMVRLRELTQREHVVRQPHRFIADVSRASTLRMLRAYLPGPFRLGRRNAFAIGYRRNRLLGYALYSFYDEPADRMMLSRTVVHIADIAVDEQERRSGLAFDLVAAVAERGRAAKADDVLAVVWGGNEASKRLFESSGFKVEHRLFALRLDEP